MPKVLNITEGEKQQRFKQQQRDANRRYYEKNKKYCSLVNARNRYIRLLNEETNKKEIVSVIIHELTINKYHMKIDEYNERIKELKK